ncbi:hypothetical protein HYS93_01365 [Candidatus Daviesbacteria bacterium]|nr:hypothetical protein [Candidatus Daviesbacteria bacterium]
MVKLKLFFQGFKLGLLEFSQSLNVILNSALLFVVYFAVIGTTAIIAKILGKHFLQLKFSKKTKSYWIDLDLDKKPLDQYLKQF